MSFSDIMAMHPYGPEIVAAVLAAISALAFGGFMWTGRKSRPWNRPGAPRMSTAGAGTIATAPASQQAKPARAALFSASDCSWRPDQFQPHAGEGFVRWLCRDCGEFGFSRSEARQPVECKRMQRPAVL